MFCNGPKTDEGDIARLGPTTIIGMTIPRCHSSLVMILDDTGGLAGPIRCHWGKERKFGYRSSMSTYQIFTTGVAASTMMIEIGTPGWRVKGHLKLKISSSVLGYELHLLVG